MDNLDMRRLHVEGNAEGGKQWRRLTTAAQQQQLVSSQYTLFQAAAYRSNVEGLIQSKLEVHEEQIIIALQASFLTPCSSRCIKETMRTKDYIETLKYWHQELSVEHLTTSNRAHLKEKASL